MTSQPLARPAPTTSSTDDALAREVLAAFRGSIKPVRSSLAYKLGLLLVAVVMLVLPAVYLALIGLVIYGVGLHLVSNLWLMDRPGLYTLILYVAPLIMGGMVVFFMIKPLFAPAGERPGTRSLTRDGEPLLFAFVDRICEVVGAPRPARIDVFAEPNAAASFRRGWLSLLTGDLVLHVGVPLVAGMSMRQFAGILAHEFGHFSQGAGMRLSYVVSSINAWFERVVYQRDQWDQWLEESADPRRAYGRWRRMRRQIIFAHHGALRDLKHADARRPPERQPSEARGGEDADVLGQGSSRHANVPPRPRRSCGRN